MCVVLRRRGLVPIHDRRYLAGLLRSQVWLLPTSCTTIATERGEHSSLKMI
jgi:hypothetical protein